MKIGIPRGLMYFNYFPTWQTFLEALGHEVLISNPSNPRVLEQGKEMAVEDVCLPVKIYLGHAAQLIKDDQVDRVFLPRYVSVEPKRYLCPQVFGAPDIVTARTEGADNKVIKFTVNYRKNRFYQYKELIRVGKDLGHNFMDTIKAYRKALKAQQEYNQKLLLGYLPGELMEGEEIRRSKKNEDNHLKISVLGHSYNVSDNFLNMDLLKKVAEAGAEVHTYEMVDRKTKKKYLSYLPERNPYWTFGEELMGAALNHAIEKKVDGVILVVAFGCGPDSLIGELCERTLKQYDIPVLYLTMEEHSGDVGYQTRLEAFFDMLERRQKVS